MKPAVASLLFLMTTGLGYAQTGTFDEILSDPDFEAFFNETERMEQRIVPARLDSRQPARVRIYSPGNDTLPVITTINPQSAGAFVTNTDRPDAYLFLSWILKNTIQFEWGGKTLVWMPGNQSFKDKLRSFDTLLTKRGLGVELNLDPSLFFCTEPGSRIRITVSYEFLLQGSFNAEQKRETVDVLIDEEGIATLPVFFESVAPGIDPAYRDLFFPMWYDAQSNAYKLKLANPKECGGQNCINYHEAAKRITEMYNRRLGTNQIVSNVFVTIEPPGFFNTVTVCRKGNCTELPYVRQQVDRYLQNATVRAKTGLKRKHLKGTIISRCNMLRKAGSRPFRTNDPGLRPVQPGDIIFIR